MVMVRESQPTLYVRIVENVPAIFLDYPAASIRDRYSATLIYQPGKIYILRHKTTASAKPKMFTVLKYLVPDPITEPVELDLVLRYFDPFSKTPRSTLSNVRFPHCLNEILSPDMWSVSLVALPPERQPLNDVIVSLEVRADERSRHEQSERPAQQKSAQSSAVGSRRDAASPLQNGKPLEIVELRRSTVLADPAPKPKAITVPIVRWRSFMNRTIAISAGG